MDQRCRYLLFSRSSFKMVLLVSCQNDWIQFRSCLGQEFYYQLVKRMQIIFEYSINNVQSLKRMFASKCPSCNITQQQIELLVLFCVEFPPLKLTQLNKRCCELAVRVTSFSFRQHQQEQIIQLTLPKQQVDSSSQRQPPTAWISPLSLDQLVNNPLTKVFYF